MVFFRILFFLTLSLPGFFSASAREESHSKPKQATQKKSFERSTGKKTSTGTPEATSAQNANEASQFERLNEEKVMSAMLSFWNLSNGKTPNQELLDAAGFEQQQVAQFKASLNSDSKIDRATRISLRKTYNADTRSEKFRARKKFINFVSEFQESFPSVAPILPEMLTVWGETRDISGFMSSDSMLLQAKMATVIQVLRNRTERVLTYSEKMRELGSAQTKWRVATRRYQFTAFEPFDPNLAILALGPRFEDSDMDMGSLAAHDEFALRTLARVLVRMQNGEIVVRSPISLTPTRHYLTPTLLRYSKRNERLLQRRVSKNSRLAMIRIPKRNPKFLAVVPNWSEQDALVEDPSVMIKELINAFTKQGIPPEEFVYFHGVL